MSKNNYRVDNQETVNVKKYAMDTLRADLVGVANIERFVNAPLMMSPQGLMPEARSVIVMAVHHPDASIELGGIKHPQDIGPYCIQYHMNWRLDDISYRMTCFLENLGYQAVGIASSNIWRYRGYKDMPEQFAPDVSHMHTAVASGLAEFGYNGLAITPEFGARQRYVTIITDAVLTPSPLVEPGSVCDNCMICRKNCRSGALSKELDGWNVVKIEDKEYRYARKNLWRCAWGEHFDLDLDLEIPEKVTEEVIMEYTRTHKRRGGEMGSCLRYCVPKNLRYWDREYTNAPRRKRHFINNAEIESFHRGLFEEIRSMAGSWGVDHVIVNNADELKTSIGVDITALMPHAVSAVTMVAHRNNPECLAENNAHTHNFQSLWNPVATQAGYDMVRQLEKFGYSACQYLNFPEEKLAAAINGVKPGKQVETLTFLTDAPLPSTSRTLEYSDFPQTPKLLTARLKQTMKSLECDLFGVAPAARLEAIVSELQKYYEGEEEFIVRNQAEDIYKPYDPVISVEKRHVKGPADHLKGARSVIVLGLRMPKKTVDITARTPAEAVGPYVFAQYETIWRLKVLAWNLIGMLERAGFNAAYSFDLNNTGTLSMNPRGEMPDNFCNTFAAVAAGLGTISCNGATVTPEFGTNVRFLSIVTDAELTGDETLRINS